MRKNIVIILILFAFTVGILIGILSKEDFNKNSNGEQIHINQILPTSSNRTFTKVIYFNDGHSPVECVSVHQEGTMTICVNGKIYENVNLIDAYSTVYIDRVEDK